MTTTTTTDRCKVYKTKGLVGSASSSFSVFLLIGDVGDFLLALLLSKRRLASTGLVRFCIPPHLGLAWL
jgi:hypothetical protein